MLSLLTGERGGEDGGGEEGGGEDGGGEDGGLSSSMGMPAVATAAALSAGSTLPPANSHSGEDGGLGSGGVDVVDRTAGDLSDKSEPGGGDATGSAITRLTTRPPLWLEHTDDV